MLTPYSVDLRARVIEDVETGASGREAAERYGISPSVVVRAGLQQTSAQGGRAYDSAALASDRSRRYRFQPARMQKILSPCRLCPTMTGIRSRPFDI
jgi:transposase